WKIQGSLELACVTSTHAEHSDGQRGRSREEHADLGNVRTHTNQTSLHIFPPRYEVTCLALSRRGISDARTRRSGENAWRRARAQDTRDRCSAATKARKPLGG